MFAEYCKLKDTFYNPKKKEYIGKNELADYQMIIDPNYVCEKGKVVLPGITIMENCSEFVCHDYTSFDIKIKTYNEEINFTCTKENAGQPLYYLQKTIDSSGNEIIYYRHFTCPDPERFCRTMKLSSMYFDKDPLDPNTKVLEGEPQEKPEWNFDYSDLYNEIETENNTEPTKHPTQNNNKLRSIYIALIVIGSLAINLNRKKSNDADSDRNLIFLNEINPNDK